jgi:hypothetical protein
MIQQGAIAWNGVSGNFWVCSRVELYPDHSGAQTTHDLYVDHAHWASGAPPIGSTDFELRRNNNPFGFAALVAVVEGYLIANAIPGRVANYNSLLSGTIVH